MKTSLNDIVSAACEQAHETIRQHCAGDWLSDKAKLFIYLEWHPVIVNSLLDGEGAMALHSAISTMDKFVLALREGRPKNLFTAKKAKRSLVDDLMRGLATVSEDQNYLEQAQAQVEDILGLTPTSWPSSGAQAPWVCGRHAAKSGNLARQLHEEVVNLPLPEVYDIQPEEIDLTRLPPPRLPAGAGSFGPAVANQNGTSLLGLRNQFASWFAEGTAALAEPEPNLVLTCRAALEKYKMTKRS